MMRSSLPSILQQIVTPCAAWTGTLGAERRTVILMALQTGLCWPLQEEPWALHIFTCPWRLVSATQSQDSATADGARPAKMCKRRTASVSGAPLLFLLAF